MTRMTDAEVMDELRSNSMLNKARAIFSSEAAGIEQANLQRVRPGPVEVRRMEFDAVRRIASALGVDM